MLVRWVARRGPRTAQLPCDNRHVAVEAFNFNCAVVLPNGEAAVIEQVGIGRGMRQDMTFYMQVRRTSKKTFDGTLHLFGTSLTNLDACPGDTRREKSAVVTLALLAWVRENGLTPGFQLEVTVGEGNGDPCHVAIRRVTEGG